jgi:hypothetical protein
MSKFEPQFPKTLLKSPQFSGELTPNGLWMNRGPQLEAVAMTGYQDLLISEVRGLSSLSRALNYTPAGEEAIQFGNCKSLNCHQTGILKNTMVCPTGLLDT